MDIFGIKDTLGIPEKKYMNKSPKEIYEMKNESAKKKGVIGFIYALVLSLIGLFIGMPKILFLTVPMMLLETWVYLKHIGFFKQFKKGAKLSEVLADKGDTDDEELDRLLGIDNKQITDKNSSYHSDDYDDEDDDAEDEDDENEQW